MEASNVDKFTKFFFWFGYVVFLLASIPHIAAYFRHFDPVTNDWVADSFYWGVAIFLAVVIDVSDVLVSIAVMKEMARGTKKRDLAGFWAFILLIMVLSWFFNWQYNLVFGTNTFANADKVSMLGFVTVGQINPIVGSAFQLLLLVYTGMAHKFAQKPKTADELKAEADRLEALEKEQQRINQYHERNKKANLIQWAKGTVIEVKDAVKEVRGPSVKEGDNEGDNELINEPDIEEPANVRRIHTTDPLQPLETNDPMEEEMEVPEGVNTDAEMEAIQTDKAGDNRSIESDSSRLTRRKPMTIAEVATVLGCTEKTVREMKKQGRLIPASSDSSLITVASVNSVLAKRQNRKAMAG